MEQRGSRLRIQLVMGAENLNMTKSRNTVAEITGSTYPEQVKAVLLLMWYIAFYVMQREAELVRENG